MRPIHIMIDGWPVVIEAVQLRDVGEELSIDIRWKINVAHKKAVARYGRLSPEKLQEANALIEDGVTNFVNAALEAAIDDVDRKHGALLDG